MTTEVRESGVMTDIETDVASDGGTDSRSGSGREALERFAPDAAKAFGMVVAVRPSGVHDELLEAPAVRAFAEQFRIDVSSVDDELRRALAAATGEHQVAVVQMIWISDVAPRLTGVLDQLFGPSEWPTPRRYPVRDVWGVIDEFMRTVARHAALDVTTTELVRLRGAREHDCRLCQSRRAVAAISAGADEAMFGAVDHYEKSDLPEATKAALALTDAIIWTPSAVPDDVIARVSEQLTDAQVVEVVLDVIRNATNKIAVALDADAPEVTEGVQLFVTDPDGVLSTV
jgi:alkylhydroperoxidase family enzyme